MAITPAPALVGRKRRQLDARAALLERVGDLKILVFDGDFGTGQRRERRRRQKRRAQHVSGDGAAGGLDVGKCHHGGLFPHFRRRYNEGVGKFEDP